MKKLHRIKTTGAVQRPGPVKGKSQPVSPRDSAERVQLAQIPQNTPVEVRGEEWQGYLMLSPATGPGVGDHLILTVFSTDETEYWRTLIGPRDLTQVRGEVDLSKVIPDCGYKITHIMGRPVAEKGGRR